MNFPNAYKGVKKIFTAEIISLVCSLCAGVLSVMTENKTPETAGLPLSGAVVFGGIVLLVLTLVSGIMNLSGLKTAADDEENFNKGFTMAVISLAVTVVAVILKALNIENKMISDLMDVVTNIADTAVTFYIVQGIINLAGKLNNKDMVGRGKKVFTIFAITVIGAAAINLVAKMVAKDSPAFAVTAIIALVVAVLSLVGYIAYLRYLDNAKTMLD